VSRLGASIFENATSAKAGESNTRLPLIAAGAKKCISNDHQHKYIEHRHAFAHPISKRSDRKNDRQDTKHPTCLTENSNPKGCLSKLLFNRKVRVNERTVIEISITRHQIVEEALRNVGKHSRDNSYCSTYRKSKERFFQVRQKIYQHARFERTRYRSKERKKRRSSSTVQQYSCIYRRCGKSNHTGQASSVYCVISRRLSRPHRKPLFVVLQGERCIIWATFFFGHGHTLFSCQCAQILCSIAAYRKAP
jgi:hypothetical protein